VLKDESKELLPCPFCGAAPDQFEDGEIQCSNKECSARPSVRWDGIAAWNTRTRLSPEEARAKAEKIVREWDALTDLVDPHYYSIKRWRMRAIHLCVRCASTGADYNDDEGFTWHRECWSAEHRRNRVMQLTFRVVAILLIALAAMFIVAVIYGIYGIR
jgi:hypothetical protein